MIYSWRPHKAQKFHTDRTDYGLSFLVATHRNGMGFTYYDKEQKEVTLHLRQGEFVLFRADMLVHRGEGYNEPGVHRLFFSFIPKNSKVTGDNTYQAHMH